MGSKHGCGSKQQTKGKCDKKVVKIAQKMERRHILMEN